MTDERDSAASGVPEPSGPDSDDGSAAKTPHSSLNVPVGEPDPTEWPDPYDHRPDPRAPADTGEDAPHTPTGAQSTSEPHPSQDPEAVPEAPKREKLDE